MGSILDAQITSDTNMGRNTVHTIVESWPGKKFSDKNTRPYGMPQCLFKNTRKSEICLDIVLVRVIKTCPQGTVKSQCSYNTVRVWTMKSSPRIWVEGFFLLGNALAYGLLR